MAWELGVLAAAASVVGYLIRKSPPSLLDRWRSRSIFGGEFDAAAGTLRLKRTWEGLTGVRDGFHVSVAPDPGGAEAFRITVHRARSRAGRGPIPEGMRLSSAEGLPWRDGEDTTVGDALFDKRVTLYGRRDLCLALLDAESRRAILHAALAGKPVRVENGAVRIDLPTAGLTAARIAEAVEEALSLAAGFAEAFKDVCASLRRNLGREPHAGVRAALLETLLADYPGEPETVAAARAALADSSPRVRLVAAAGLGDEGLDALRELAGSRAPEARVAVEALATALDRSAPDRIAGLLREALRGPWPAQRAAALTTVARRRDASCEAEVVRLLGDPDAAVRRAAVAAAAAVGTVDAVPVLRALASESGALDFALRAAADGAVAAIQARLGGAAPGQLVVADAEGAAGGLSLAAAAGGGDLALASSGGDAGGDRAAEGRVAGDGGESPVSPR